MDLSKYDPSKIVSKKLKLKGFWKEVVELGMDFLVAAVFYFIIMPLILGANPAAVVVESCSMAGTFNVGEVIVLQGTSFNDINAQEITINESLSFQPNPSNYEEETKTLTFSDGQTINLNKEGDIIVYVSPTSGQQIIHRVVAKVRSPQGNFVLTKGDANKIVDQEKLGCDKWEKVPDGYRCLAISNEVNSTCSLSDKGWPGCIASPLQEKDIVGKMLFHIPFLGHVKMLFFHLITLGHGYPGGLWC